jgi:pyocin large subunit-like protein
MEIRGFPTKRIDLATLSEMRIDPRTGCKERWSTGVSGRIPRRSGMDVVLELYTDAGRYSECV